jgi:hypothetical protein
LILHIKPLAGRLGCECRSTASTTTPATTSAPSNTSPTTTLTAQAATDDDDISGCLEAQAFTFNPVDPGTYTCTLVVDP